MAYLNVCEDTIYTCLKGRSYNMVIFYMVLLHMELVMLSAAWGVRGPHRPAAHAVQLSDGVCSAAPHTGTASLEISEGGRVEKGRGRCVLMRPRGP